MNFESGLKPFCREQSAVLQDKYCFDLVLAAEPNAFFHSHDYTRGSHGIQQRAVFSDQCRGDQVTL